MSLIKCPFCGNKYSETYDECPFCDEQMPEQPRRKTQSTKPTKKTIPATKRGVDLKLDPSLLSPILIVVLVLMIALLIYLLFGDKIKDGMDSDPTAPSVSEPSVEEEVPEEEPGVMPEVEVEAPVAPATSVSLNRSDFTLSGGESFTVEASGGSGVYTWSMDSSSVASVTSGGLVTPVSNGTATLTVTDGYTTATCIVRVKNMSTTSSSTTTTTTTTTSGATLSRTDITLSVGESYTLSVSSGTATFSVDNASVATVTEGGTVTAVASGNTNVVATVDGTTLTCIVRVK